MIPNIMSSSVSFKSNTKNPVRDLYDDHLSAISQTAQKQTNIITSPTASIPNLNAPIPMQGIGQRLNVIA